jgi:putative FmdB family regulatory protein
MPTYDYECGECGHTFEMVLPIPKKDKPTSSNCPVCGEKKVKKIIGAPVIADIFRLDVRSKDPGMRDLLQKIHQRTPGSQLDQSATEF